MRKPFSLLTGQVKSQRTAIQYLRDLAVAYAKNGQFDESEKTLTTIKKLKIDEEVTWYIEAEIASKQKKNL